MIVNLVDSFAPTSSATITDFEVRRGFMLPAEYKRFLLRSNGGRPVPDVFDVPGWSQQASCVSDFFGLHDGPDANLEKEAGFFPTVCPLVSFRLLLIRSAM